MVLLTCVIFTKRSLAEFQAYKVHTSFEASVVTLNVKGVSVKAICWKKALPLENQGQSAFLDAPLSLMWLM